MNPNPESGSATPGRKSMLTIPGGGAEVRRGFVN